MPNSLFLQSEVENPYEIYETKLREGSVLWDGQDNLWAIYSYEGCKSILTNHTAQIPVPNREADIGLNESALTITGRLVRISNGIQHEVARQTALLLFEKINTVPITRILDELLSKSPVTKEMDWVGDVCKTLPIKIILNGFGFDETDGHYMLDKISLLVKIMLPVSNQLQASAINEIASDIYSITENHILADNFYKNLIVNLCEQFNLDSEEALKCCVSNLIGLFIQSYEGTWGLLGNALLQILTQPNISAGQRTNREFLERAVVETIRFYSPLHNTRRIASGNIILEGKEIKKGQAIFLVIAAANRDPKQFKDPNTFNTERSNNDENLTFGAGAHSCFASRFSVWAATEALRSLFEKYPNIQLLESRIQYEPRINVRIPQRMNISLTK